MLVTNLLVSGDRAHSQLASNMEQVNYLQISSKGQSSQPSTHYVPVPNLQPTVCQYPAYHSHTMYQYVPSLAPTVYQYQAYNPLRTST